MRRLAAVAAAAAVALPPARAAHAQGLFGQSFTAPLTAAPVLTALTVAPSGIDGDSGGGEYVARIFAFDGTALVGPALFERVLGARFRGLALVPNRLLLPGATYAVVVASVPGGVGLGLGSNGDQYPGGTALGCGTPSRCAPLFSPATGDLVGFAVTFGPRAVVPEPATWALVAAGLAGVAAVSGVARRRGV